MGILILSILIGLLVGMGVIALIMRKDVLEEDDYNNSDLVKKFERKLLITFLVAIIITIGVSIGSFYLMRYEVNKNVEREIAEYTIAKITYEEALKNSNLTGLERLQIIKVITEENKNLANRKVMMTRWARFDIKDELKLQMLELEYINVS